MVKAMKYRDVERALRANECSIKSTRGSHEKWVCKDGDHSVVIVAGATVSPGVIRDAPQAHDLPTGGMAGMITYEVTAKRWAHGWELHIAGVGVTQARTLLSAEDMVRDYVTLSLDLAEDAAFDVNIVPELDGNLATEAEAAREAVRRAEKARNEAATQSRDIAKRLKAAGLSGADIAAVMKVSTQRVSQLVNS